MNENVARWGNRVIEILAAAALVWATAALGAAWGWGLAVAFALLAAAFCAWAALRLPAGNAADLARRDPASVCPAPPLGVRSRLAVVLVCLLGAYVFFQLLPLPADVAAWLSPFRVTQEQELRRALGEPPARAMALSVDPAGSRRALSLVVVTIMAFVLGAYLAASRKRARRLMWVLLAAALLEALYGLAEDLTGHHHIFWIAVQGDFARGTFYNRNHFAATLSLFLPPAIGWFYFRVSMAKSRHDRTHMLPATSWDLLGSREGLWLLAPVILAVGIIQSGSRGGFSSMVLGMALFFALGGRSRPARAVSWLTIPLALALFAYGLQSDYLIVLDRFGDLVSDAGGGQRTRIWSDSLAIVRDYRLFGVGLGNFPRVYMQYASADTLTYPYQAHNEWLEGLITLGAVGMALVVALVFVFFVKTFLETRRAGRDQPWLLGIWCGLVGLAFHCVGEFNLHIPSIAATAAFLAGMLLGFKSPEPGGRSGSRPTAHTRS